MLDIANKVIIAIPDSNPNSGFGHISRTLSLLSRFKSASDIYLILDDLPQGYSNSSFLFSKCSTIDDLPKAIFKNEILLIYDSYDYERFVSICGYISFIIPQSRLKILLICDTLNQAKSFLCNSFSIDLFVPNIISPQFRSALIGLCSIYNCSLYDGYPYILLDQVTINTPVISNLRPNLDRQEPVCLISFGFSSFSFTPQFLAHSQQFLSYIIKQFQSIQFRLVGTNALRLFTDLKMCESIASYHQFLHKSSLIKMYDSSSFYFGSLGYSMWERAFRLLPSFVYPIAENQMPYVDVGSSLNLLRSSYDVLEYDLDLFACLNSMHKGTLNFRETFMLQSVF